MVNPTWSKMVNPTWKDMLEVASDSDDKAFKRYIFSEFMVYVFGETQSMLITMLGLSLDDESISSILDACVGKPLDPDYQKILAERAMVAKEGYDMVESNSIPIM